MGIFLLHFPFNTKCCFPFNQVLIKWQERKGNPTIGVKFLTNSNTTIRGWCRSSAACQILTMDASNKCISPPNETRRRSSPQPMTPPQKQRALMEVCGLKAAGVASHPPARSHGDSAGRGAETDHRDVTCERGSVPYVCKWTNSSTVCLKNSQKRRGKAFRPHVTTVSGLKVTGRLFAVSDRTNKKTAEAVVSPCSQMF